MAKRYLIETFGCQMNVHDSERMAGLLEQDGYQPATEDSDADVIVINTCSVREHAEEKLYTRLGELRVLEEETGRQRSVVVAGCVAQQEGTALLKKSNGHMIDVVLGTQSVKTLPTLLTDGPRRSIPVIQLGALEDVGFPVGVARRSDAVRAYVTIIEGCNEFCSFCVVPYTRGHERMRARADILAEVQQAAAAGLKEVQLLGQIVNHYQAPDTHAYDFASLLTDANEVDGLRRIRFASPHPRHTGERLIEAIRDLPKVCKHIHLPLQSGSTRVLANMRRRHTREDYLALVDRLRTTVPGITLSTDIIVGFPGETTNDFEDTLSLVRQVGFNSIYSFKYSPRPNTLASKRMPDNVTEQDKTARIVALQALQRELQLTLHQSMLGTQVQVLIDGVSRRRESELSGRTGGNTVVNMPIPDDRTDSWIGEVVNVELERAGPNSMSGRITSRIPA